MLIICNRQLDSTCRTWNFCNVDECGCTLHIHVTPYCQVVNISMHPSMHVAANCQHEDAHYTCMLPLTVSMRMHTTYASQFSMPLPNEINDVSARSVTGCLSMECHGLSRSVSAECHGVSQYGVSRSVSLRDRTEDFHSQVNCTSKIVLAKLT